MAISKSSPENSSSTVSVVHDDNDDTILPSVSDDKTNATTFFLYDLPEKTVFSPFHAFISSTDLVVLALISSWFNSILNLGCTMHIIHDKQFFKRITKCGNGKLWETKHISSWRSLFLCYHQ